MRSLGVKTAAVTFLLWSAFCLLASTDGAGALSHQIYAALVAHVGEPAARQWLMIHDAVAQKLFHVFEFACLGVIAQMGRSNRLRAAAITAGLIICLLTEALQSLTATRTASWTDVALNVTFFTAAVLIFRAQPPQRVPGLRL